MAKTFIEINANPPPPFESDDNYVTIPYFGDDADEVDEGEDKVDDCKHGDKVNFSQKVEECVSILLKKTEGEKNAWNNAKFKSKKLKHNCNNLSKMIVNRII